MNIIMLVLLGAADQNSNKIHQLQNKSYIASIFCCDDWFIRNCSSSCDELKYLLALHLLV
jgi:hypothetical protein